MNRNKLALFTITALLLVFIWARQGLFVATGESGLLFYNTLGASDYYKYSWSKGAIGLPAYYTVASYPFLFFIGSIIQAGISPTIMQMLLFFVAILIGMLSISKLVTELFQIKSENETILTIVPSLIYTFNLFAMVNIWNRLQYTFIIFYALVPLALWLYILGLKKNKFLYAIILNLIFVALSMPLSTIPLLELLWALLASYTLYYSIVNKNNKKEILSAWCYFVGSIILWLIFNFWWLLSTSITILNTKYFTEEAYNTQGNLETFKQISKTLGHLSYIFRLMQSEFFKNIQQVWWGIYASPIFIILSYIPPLLAFYPLLLKKKPAILFYFLGLSLLIIFLMKGSEPPFGYFTLFLFQNIRALEPFRNPFEKVGILLPLTYAPLIGYSLLRIYQDFNNQYFIKQKKLLVSISIFLICGVLVFPYWNRWIFSSVSPPSNNLNIGDYVQVPSYYKEANDWLNKSNQEYRVISLPMSGEGITHTWQYGYSGVEASNGLFDRPFISMTTSIQFLKPITEQIEPLLSNHPGRLVNLMQLLNVNKIIVRNDVDYNLRQMTTPDQIKDKLNKAIPVHYEKSFGQLDLYTLDDGEALQKIYASTTAYTFNNAENKIYTHILPFVPYQKAEVFINDKNEDQRLTQFEKEKLYVAKQQIEKEKFSADEKVVPLRSPNISLENVLDELPFLRILPNNKLYNLIELKENIAEYLQGGSWEDKQFKLLRKSGKRLKELYELIHRVQETELINKTSEKYHRELFGISKEYIYDSVGVQQELMRHKLVLNMIANLSKDLTTIPKFTESKSYIDTLFEKGIPINQGDKFEYKNRYFEMTVPEEAPYQLYIITENNLDLSGTKITINGSENLISKSEDSIKTNLKKGVNRINLEIDKTAARYHENLQNIEIAIKTPSINYVYKQTPSVQFTKINQTQYQVSVKNVTSSHILVFSDAFHPLWKISIDNKQLNENSHFIANGFANAWYIDKTGDYQATINFEAEKYFILGKKISVIAIAFSIAVAILLKIYILIKTQVKKGKK